MRLFGLDSFSHQSCATGTLLLLKGIYPRKFITNLYQLIFLTLTKIHYICLTAGQIANE